MAGNLKLEPLPPAEAIRFFRRKGYRIGFDWRDVWQQEHTRAFTVAKAMRLEILQVIRAEVDRAIADGITFEQFKKSLTPTLQQLGWWGRKTLVDPLTGEAVEAQLGSPRRLRIIYDTNLRTARAAGRWERIERNKARRPFLRYSQIQRPTKRDEHIPFHGLIRPVDDPIWDRIYPPNGWNCGCIVQQLTRRQAERRGITPAAEAARLMGRRRRWINKRTGEVLSVTRGVTPGWDYHVGKQHMRGIAQSLESLLNVADQESAVRALREIVSSESLTDFLVAPERWGFFPIMILDQSLARRIGAKTRVMRLSAETLVKQRERHPEITEADYRSLVDLGIDPDLVIQDGERTLVLLRQGDNWLWVALKATRSGKAGFITSVRRARDSDVRRRAAKGRVVKRKR